MEQITTLFSCVAADCDGTEQVGARLARHLLEARADTPDATFLALYGDLGAGKTALVRGLAGVLTPDVLVSSPTYALVNEYRNERDGIVLYHFDMYRITDEDDLYSIGFYDYFDARDRRCPYRILAAEWCENIPYALPDRYYKIEIEKLSDGRKITISLVTRENGIF